MIKKKDNYLTNVLKITENSGHIMRAIYESIIEFNVNFKKINLSLFYELSNRFFMYVYFNCLMYHESLSTEKCQLIDNR